MPSPEKNSPPAPPSDSITIHQNNPLLADDWDRLIAPHPDASIFHGSAWAKVLSDTYGFTPVYLSADREKKLTAALPVFEIDSWLTGKRGVSLPFADECEALGFSGASASPLVEAALETGRARGWRYLELRGGQKLFNDAPPSISFHGHKLDLAATPDSLFARCESSVRRAVRKAENSGLKVEFSQTLPATAVYYSLHCHTRKEHGLPPQPFKFFRQIHRHIIAKNLGVVVTATLKKRPVASAIFFHLGSSAIYKFGASLKAAQETRANNLVMWEAIKLLAAKGLKELSFGRTSLHHEGLRRYKLGWGAQEYSIHYYKYDLRANALVAGKDDSSGWHNTVFRALPQPLARFAGSLLYKHMA